MVQEVFGLRYDFVYRHGHYMELHREGGIPAGELSGLQLRMLESNRIPRLLPLGVQEMDFRISLLYNLTGKRMLSHVLKAEGLTSRQFAKLLYAVVCTLEESKNYMLLETQYVLKDNFIFIGNDWSDVYLTYVPLEQPKEEIPLQVQVEELAVLLASNVKTGGDSGVSRFIESFSNEWELDGCKKKLLELLDEQEHPRSENCAPPATVERAERSDAAHIGGSRAESGLASRMEEQPSGLPKPVWNTREEDEPSRLFDQQPGPASPALITLPTRRAKWIVVAVCLLLAAFMWQDYFSAPTEAGLRIVSGITVLFADAWFVASYVGIPQFWAKRSPASLKPAVQPAAKTGNETFTVGQPGAESEPEPVSLQQYYQNLHMHTTLLQSANANETVFLGAALSKPQVPRIELFKDGVQQTAAIEKESFTIGRGGEGAGTDYVCDETGISRLHAEILKTDEAYAVKDLGSTNGTFLNGQPLVPYQAYALKDGDTIRIVRMEITFRF